MPRPKKTFCPIHQAVEGKKFADKKKRPFEEVFTNMCADCKHNCESGIVLVCINCDSLTVIDVEKMRKYVPDVEAGNHCEIWACPGCPVTTERPNKQFHFLPTTKPGEAVHEVMKEEQAN